MHRADPPQEPILRFLSWDRAEELDLAGTGMRLDPDARHRLDASSASEARRFLIGRALLVRTVASAFDTVAQRVDVTARCPDCGLAHGRPRARIGDRTVHVSISHTTGASAVAVSATHPVGVDIERLDAARFAGVETVALSADELQHWRRLPEPARTRALAEHWTAKEAVVKALGTGLTLDPAAIVVSPHTGKVVETTGRRFAVDLAEPADGFVAATALLLA